MTVLGSCERPVSTAFAFKVGVHANTLAVSHDGSQTWQTIHASLAPSHA